MVLCLAAASSSAYGALFGVSPVDPANGFPQFYRDTNGVNLVLGINDAALTAFDPVIPGNAFSVQTGFGAEAFYWAGESIIDLPGGGTALLVLALEAAYANEDPADGDQVVFGRVRIRIDVTTPGTYTVIHPYGTDVFPNVPPGTRAINMTRDIGLAAGDFEAALTSDIGPFLIAVSPPPPTGFVGDPGVAQTVTGSPTGNNFFKIIGPAGADLDGLGGNEVESTLFSVQGELAGPDLPAVCTGDIVGDLNNDCKVDLEDLAIFEANLFACNLDPAEDCFGSTDPNIIISPVTFDFGNVDVGASSTTKTFTITNVGPDPMTIGAINITHTDAAEFIFTNVDANDVTVDPNGIVEFQVTFSPTSVGEKTAIVEIPFYGSSLAIVSLSGCSGAPDITSDLTSKDFGEVGVGSVNITTQVFTISNVGDDDLLIDVVSLTGTNASEFLITVDNCSNLTLPPGASCTLTAAFNPTSAGEKTASISIPSDDPDEDPYLISLAGTAIAAKEVTIDNEDGEAGGASSTGTWLVSGGANHHKANSVYNKTTGKKFMFSADLFNVQYAVFMRWTTWPSRFTNVPVQIHSGSTLLDTVTVNQQRNGGTWVLLGIYTFADTAKVTITAQSGGSTNADAVKFKPVSQLTEIIIDNSLPGASSTGTWLVSGAADHFGVNSVYSKNIADTFTFTSGATGTFNVYAWWTLWPSRHNNVPVDIFDGSTLLDSGTIDQTSNGGQWNLLGTFTFSDTANVRITSERTDKSTNADAIKFEPQ